MKNYSKLISEDVAEKMVLMGMPMLNNRRPGYVTYANVFDWLIEHGIIITLKPFFTFALADNVGYTWKISFVDKENADMTEVTEQLVYDPSKGYGGSFERTMDDALGYIISQRKVGYIDVNVEDL